MAWFYPDPTRAIWYQTAGDPLSPAVLLLHGFTGSHRIWQEFLQGAGQWFWVTPDLPGHGRSSTPERLEFLTMEQMADDLAALMKSLAKTPYGVLGYSMGARLALHVACRHKDTVAALMLESGSPGLASEDEREVRRAQDDLLAERIIREGIPSFVAYWESLPLFSSQRRLPPERLSRERHVRLGQSAFGLAQSLRGAGTGSQSSLWACLAELSMPALVITGQLDVKYVNIGQEMARQLPDSRLAEVAAAGHTVHLERPDEFSRIVEDFLADVFPGRAPGR